MNSFTHLSNHLSSLAKMLMLLSSKEWFFSFKCKWTTESFHLWHCPHHYHNNTKATSWGLHCDFWRLQSRFTRLCPLWLCQFINCSTRKNTTVVPQHANVRANQLNFFFNIPALAAEACQATTPWPPTWCLPCSHITITSDQVRGQLVSLHPCKTTGLDRVCDGSPISISNWVHKHKGSV